MNPIELEWQHIKEDELAGQIAGKVDRGTNADNSGNTNHFCEQTFAID